MKTDIISSNNVSYGSYRSYGSYDAITPSHSVLKILFIIVYSLVGTSILLASFSYIIQYITRIQTIVREYLLRLYILPFLILGISSISVVVPRIYFMGMTSISVLYYAWYVLTLGFIHLEMYGVNEFPTTVTNVRAYGNRPMRMYYTDHMLTYIAQLIPWSFLSIFLWITIAISSIHDISILSISWLLWIITTFTALRTFIALHYILNVRQLTEQPNTTPALYLCKLFYMVILMFLYDISFGMFEMTQNNPIWWHNHLHLMIHLLFVCFSYCMWKKLVKECTTGTLLNTRPTHPKNICKLFLISIHPLRSYSHHKMYQSSLHVSPRDQIDSSDLQAEYNAL